MGRIRNGGRVPPEVITGAVINSRLAKKLKARIKDRLARMEPKRLRRWCIVALAVMLAGDTALIIKAGRATRLSVPYSAIRPVTTTGDQERRPPVKGFGVVWNRLMNDSADKRAWDSLLWLRPGLRDTIRELQRMDSTVLFR